MKGSICACLLAALQSMTVAQAYEGDIHYSTTYVLARAVGWSQADALTIASANQAVDENRETVAALEMDAAPGAPFASHVTSSLHQAGKNLDFHCFSATRAPAGSISQDVRDAIAGRFAALPADDGLRAHARRSIALGAALHCQQDAIAHVDFGGTCGAFPGSCYGHTHESFLDQVTFKLLGKHLYNPDHPGVSGRRLQEALDGTSRGLAASGPGKALRRVPARALAELSAALRTSGLELPDEVRRDCNRYLAGKWLFEFLHSAREEHAAPDALERLPPEVAVICGNASLASATVIRIPAPRFPRLNADASPYLVSADGTYQSMRDGDFDASSPLLRATGIAALAASPKPRKVQLSHWSQVIPFLSLE
jgi:hypothetical protein